MSILAPSPDTTSDPIDPFPMPIIPIIVAVSKTKLTARDVMKVTTSISNCINFKNNLLLKHVWTNILGLTSHTSKATDPHNEAIVTI